MFWSTHFAGSLIVKTVGKVVGEIERPYWMQGVLFGFKILQELLMRATEKTMGLWRKRKRVILGRQKQGPKFGLGKFITNMSFIINEEKYCNLLAAKPNSRICKPCSHTQKGCALVCSVWFWEPTISLSVFLACSEAIVFRHCFSGLYLKRHLRAQIAKPYFP